MPVNAFTVLVKNQSANFRVAKKTCMATTLLRGAGGVLLAAGQVNQSLENLIYLSLTALK